MDVSEMLGMMDIAVESYLLRDGKKSADNDGSCSDGSSGSSSEEETEEERPKKTVPKHPILLPMQEEIHEKLKMMGVKHPKQANFCVNAAIAKGFIKITGDPEDMDMVVHEEEGRCGHMIKATLRDLLKQPDAAAGLLGEIDDATVLCSYRKSGGPGEEFDEDEGNVCGHGDEDKGRTYVVNMCSGKPRFDTDGRYLNHCTKCEWFGHCMGDYRMKHCLYCNRHFYHGAGGLFHCDCRDSDHDTSDYTESSESECSEHDECVEEIEWEGVPYFMKAREEQVYADYKADNDKMLQDYFAKMEVNADNDADTVLEISDDSNDQDD